MKSNSPSSAACLALVAAGIVAMLAPGAASADWPVFGHDSARSGHAATNTAITSANVTHLYQRWVAPLDAVADSAPIFVGDVLITGGRRQDMLYLTSRHGTTFAFEADTGRVVWKFTTHGPNITTSVPAADPSVAMIYAAGVDGFVHRLSASTGTELDGNFPVRLTWNPEVEKIASALNLANGYLYAVTSGYFGDYGDYVGHVVAIKLQNGSVHIFNSLCADVRELFGADRDRKSCPQSKSGIWSRGGAVVDPDPSMHGRIYIATGNGPFTADRGGHDYGDSVLALSADGSTLEDFFTPSNFAELEDGDVDLGSTAPVLLPREPKSRTPLLALQGGKDGLMRLLDRMHLGGVGGDLARYDLGAGVFSAPAVWRTEKGNTRIAVGTSSAVTALEVATDAHGKSELRKVWTANVGGTSPVVANDLIFAATDDAVNAIDARTGKIVWSSGKSGAGGSIGGIHWESPIVIDDWLYISDDSGHLTGYSL